jgi:hypothetical protein
MKLQSTIAVFSEANLIPTCGHSTRGDGETDPAPVEAEEPPVAIMGLCEVNGIDYPIDFNFQIWQRKGCGQWAAIGRVLATMQCGWF